MTVTWVVNCGQMFNNCSCASKWELVSVNGSRISLVGRRHEKPVGHLKFCLVVQFFLSFIFIFLTTAQPQRWHNL